MFAESSSLLPHLSWNPALVGPPRMTSASELHARAYPLRGEGEVDGSRKIFEDNPCPHTVAATCWFHLSVLLLDHTHFCGILKSTIRQTGLAFLAFFSFVSRRDVLALKLCTSNLYALISSSSCFSGAAANIGHVALSLNFVATNKSPALVLLLHSLLVNWQTALAQ
jgi:hypothetical protein